MSGVLVISILPLFSAFNWFYHQENYLLPELLPDINLPARWSSSGTSIAWIKGAVIHFILP